MVLEPPSQRLRMLLEPLIPHALVPLMPTQPLSNSLMTKVLMLPPPLLLNKPPVPTGELKSQREEDSRKRKMVMKKRKRRMMMHQSQELAVTKTNATPPLMTSKSPVELPNSVPASLLPSPSLP